MKSFSIFIFLLLFFGQATGQKNKVPNLQYNDPLVFGEHVAFYSKVLEESRTLNIYLPRTYSTNPSKEYPVVYLLDGDYTEDFIHIAGLIQFGSFPKVQLLPESIVVGIENIDRNKDFTSPSNNPRDVSEITSNGGSSKFIRFIEDELQPFIAANYKASEDKTLIGRSLGGLLATEILFKKPDLFKNYIIVSPSLWWNNEALLKRNPKKIKNKKSVYITVGKEGALMEGLAYRLRNKLNRLDNENLNVYFKYLQNQNHMDILHLAVYDGFDKIYNETRNTEN